MVARAAGEETVLEKPRPEDDLEEGSGQQGAQYLSHARPCPVHREGQASLFGEPVR